MFREVSGPVHRERMTGNRHMKRDDDTLEQAESLDSDEVRNDDGDQVADPPDEWIGADDNDSL
ncbi:MAG: hypothetical protein QOF25_1630, partial [Mycobacterium sp.]|nr:hypothetical protein [Mycobacterium sp.]